ncbi:MAG: DUF348 domain-containing protein [Anaerolineales bacterium]|nr:MAG: DUF348 domain-containing protein [Anaerolineales bacterium]
MECMRTLRPGRNNKRMMTQILTANPGVHNKSAWTVFSRVTWSGLFSFILIGLIMLQGCAENTLPQSPVEITLIVDGSEKQLQSDSKSVLEFLSEQGVILSESDRVSPPETARLIDQMTVAVTRVIYVMETVTNTVPYERKVVRDATLPEGESRLLQSGSPGVREVKYRLTLENGIQSDRILISDVFISSPKVEIRVIGTRTELGTIYINGTLAYLNRQDGWIIRDNNQERRRLTSSGDLDGRVFELSPDSTLLLYTRGVTFTTTFNELWLVRTTEANPNAVPLNVQNVLWAGWSPVNQEIAWTTAESTDRPPGWRGENDLWTATMSTKNILTNRKQIKEPEVGSGYGWWGTRYSWSPNGNQLAFSLPQSIGIIDIKTTTRITLQTFPAYKTYNSWAWNPEISWSSDGLFIISTVHDKAPGGGDSEESPVFNIRTLDVTGVYSAQIVSEAGMWAYPKLSPDGATILYGKAIVPYQSATSRYRLCIIDIDGSNQHCFFPEENEPGIEIPLWMWDSGGENVAYIENGDLRSINITDWTSQTITDDGQITQFDWR